MKTWYPYLVFILLLVLSGCAKENNETSNTATGTLDKDLLTQAKDSPAGKWQIIITASGASSDITVTNDKIDYSGYSFYSASGSIGTIPIKGVLMVDDSTTPGGARLLWLREKASGALDGESSMLLKVENNELVLGGDSASETTDLFHLKRL